MCTRCVVRRDGGIAVEMPDAKGRGGPLNMTDGRAMDPPDFLYFSQGKKQYPKVLLGGTGVVGSRCKRS